MTTRRLAAILAADVVGFSCLMGHDEEGTLTRIKRLRHEIIEPAVAQHHGRIFKTTGDGFLVEFASPVEAVRCAVAVQEALASEAAQDPSQALSLRIGINLGDIIIEGDGDIYGDGVNVAARLQELADPGGISISSKVYDEVRDKVAYVFEDRGEQQVKNIVRPVSVYSLSGTSTAAFRPTLPIPDKPSIAVLPFNNMSADPNDEFLADGIVEEIIAALSRVRSFFVIARNSTFTYKGRAVNVQHVSRELGVRYVLEGSVRRSRNRVRVTAQLIDATTGAHLWGDRYEGSVEDVFDLQDDITASVVGALQPSLRAAEIERARRKRPEKLDAYDLVMRSLPFAWSLDRASNETATELLTRALALDPSYPLALSLSAWCSAQRVFYMWSSDVEKDKRETLEKAQAAADIAPDDPFVLTALCAALTNTRELQAAQVMIEKALALDPNSAWAWNRSGWIRNYLDDPESAIVRFEKAIRLSPLDPSAFMCHAGIGMAHFIAGRYETSAVWLKQALLSHSKMVSLHRLLAPACVFTGNQREAEASVCKLVAAYPNVSLNALRTAWAYSDEVKDRLCEGLRRAGLPA